VCSGTRGVRPIGAEPDLSLETGGAGTSLSRQLRARARINLVRPTQIRRRGPLRAHSKFAEEGWRSLGISRLKERIAIDEEGALVELEAVERWLRRHQGPMRSKSWSKRLPRSEDPRLRVNAISLRSRHRRRVVKNYFHIKLIGEHPIKGRCWMLEAHAGTGRLGPHMTTRNPSPSESARTGSA